MAYDKTYPQSSDTVSASKIRENFLALFEGRVEHEKLLLKNGTVPASGDADSINLYAKDVDSGGTDYAELHSKDEQDQEVQLTSNGRLGSSTTPLTTSAVRFGTAATDFNADNLIRAWAYFEKKTSNDPLTVLAGTGLSGERTGTGKHTITITNTLADGNYGVFGTVNTDGNTGDIRILSVHTQTDSTFKIRIADDTNAAKDHAFFVAVVGGTLAP